MEFNDNTIKLIEKTLSIKLYQHQKDWLINGDTMPSDRCNGKTFVHCIYRALSEGEPLDISKPELFCDGDYGTRNNIIRYARGFYGNLFLNIWHDLKNAGFPVRKLKNMKNTIE